MAGFTPDVKFLIDTVLGNTGKLFINNTAAVIAICSVEPTNEDTLYRLSRAVVSVGWYYLGAFASWANVNFLLDFADPMRTFQFVKDCAVISYVNHAVSPRRSPSRRRSEKGVRRIG